MMKIRMVRNQISVTSDLQLIFLKVLCHGMWSYHSCLTFTSVFVCSFFVRGSLRQVLFVVVLISFRWQITTHWYSFPFYVVRYPNSFSITWFVVFVFIVFSYLFVLYAVSVTDHLAVDSAH
jgi:hypothetical protein